MIKRYRDYPLSQLNSFGVDVIAADYIYFETRKDIYDLINKKEFDLDNFFLIGGGCNLLFLEDFTGSLLHCGIEGISVIDESEKDVLISVGAGCWWDSVVKWCVDREYYGIENLSYIPGTMGAAVVQNIGAYGSEIKDVLNKVEYVDINSAEKYYLRGDECKMGYRSSLFKSKLKNRAVITSVCLKLSKKPSFNLSYGNLKVFVESKWSEITLNNVRSSVIEIRKSKLPDYKVFGNAGSFFKNPVVNLDIYRELQLKFDDIPGYVIDRGDQIKIPAAWLIEKAGWKGYSENNVAVHSEQPLVLINKGGATGAQIYSLSKAIMEDIKDKFEITLEREVEVVSSNLKQQLLE
ncbi:UDP-N-acetylmuramate dehydrogenase [Marinilabiliaceae bacterium ANBcel2]|nr:UDP-N-acetylmuramate dehydrogenase [Marinilabiliaceae bacterium ANBcel2]